MPHLIIEYSSNLDESVDITSLCASLRDAAAATGIFPLAGIRVRAFRSEHYAIADGAPSNGFIDISVRLREGRPAEVRKRAASEIFEAAEQFLRPALESLPLALSLELRNIDAELSPKINTIRSRTAGADK